MLEGWNDFNEKLPQVNSWVEVIYIYLGVIEYFYAGDTFHKGRFTHWRYITHSIFSPVEEEVYILELH